MKKILLFILALSAPALADINVTQGSGKTVATETNNSREYQTIELVTPGGASTATITNGLQNMNIAGTGFAASTVTFNAISQPVNLTATTLGITTVTFNGTVQPINIAQTGMATTTTTFNGTTQPVYETTSIQIMPSTGTPATFVASTNTFSMATSTADFTGICGNIQNTVRVYGLRISCTQTTAGITNLSVVRRSTAYTQVWSSMTTQATDTNFGVAASTAIFWTAFPVTDGTLSAQVDNYQLGCMASATTTPNDIYISPASWRMRPITLRGTSQCLGVNTQSTTVTGNKWTVEWEWMESP